jgi:hypothetical protein
MSQFDAVPPKTLKGGNDAHTGQGDIPYNPALGESINMDEYRRTVPWWKRAYKHSLTQMMLLSVQAFCGPAMWDAIAGLCPPMRWFNIYQPLNVIRSRRWWSCNPPNIQHLVRNMETLDP